MANFDFETFDFDDNENIILKSGTNFELYLIAAAAITFLIKTEEDADKVKGGDMPAFISYSRWAADKINDLATSRDINNTTPEMKPVIKNVFAALDHARQVMAANPSRSKVGDFEDEFWWFYSEAVESLVDSVKIMKDEHKKMKGTDDDYEHHTRIKFTHGDNSWTYCVRIKDGKPTDIRGFMNGSATKFHDLEKTHEACQEAVNVDFLLKNVARSIALERGYVFLSTLAAKDTTAVSKARTIAIVLGGDYKNYLLPAKHFAASFKNVLNDTSMTEDKAARLILDKQLRLTESQMLQVISILKPQAAWC